MSMTLNLSEYRNVLGLRILACSRAVMKTEIIVYYIYTTQNKTRI